MAAASAHGRASTGVSGTSDAGTGAAAGFVGAEENPHRHHPRRSVRRCGCGAWIDCCRRAYCRPAAEPRGNNAAAERAAFWAERALVHRSR